MELNRSVKLLEEALTPHKINYTMKATPKKSPKDFRRSYLADGSLDLSVSVSPEEIKYVLGDQMSYVDNTLYNILQDSSVLGSAIRSDKPWESVLDSLFVEYLEIKQAHSNFHQVFETVTEIVRCCTDTLNVIKGLKTNIKLPFSEKWLIEERNTWRLLFCLYQDRLNNASSENGEFIPYMGTSEKLCIEHLFKRESFVREAQIIIDWLECNAIDNDLEEPGMNCFTDKLCTWENTAHELKMSEHMVRKNKYITEMDPDAPDRQNLALHDLDKEDDKRLAKIIFKKIRCGKIDEAQEIALTCGQPWRAIILEGWKLFHDPNTYDELTEAEENMQVDDNVGLETKLDAKEQLIQNRKKKQEELLNYEEKPIEGNLNRDIWKLNAWEFCYFDELDNYDKASVASLCGCIDALLRVCQSWEDELWSYMKTLVDVRVESEIRDFVRKNYEEMPEEYWKNKMSLNDVFHKIACTTNNDIKQEILSPYHTVQQYVILDDISQLMEKVEVWIEMDNPPPHLLRFLAHLILFFKQIGCCQREDIADEVLKRYVSYLIIRGEPQLVAFYTATLNISDQEIYYATFLEKITNIDDRKEVLKYAEMTGLNIKSITKRVVECIRNKHENIDEQLNKLQRTITELDKLKISALDWLLFYPEQHTEALIQCNALIAYFLTVKKIDAAKVAFEKIPSTVIDELLSIPEKVTPAIVQNSLQEFHCYQAYIEAYEVFNDWFKCFHSKKNPPPPLPESASFSEKVAHEHRISQYNSEIERWQLSVNHLMKLTKTKIINVLKFPNGGWLVGPEMPSELRRICIPEIIMLLYIVLSKSGKHTECLKLPRMICSRTYKLYEVYTPSSLEDLLQRCKDSAVCIMEEEKELWDPLLRL